MRVDATGAWRTLRAPPYHHSAELPPASRAPARPSCVTSFVAMTFADIARAELRRLGGAFWRGLWKTDLLLAGLMALALIVDVLQTDSGAITRDPLNTLFMLVIGALYLLATAAV